MRELEQGLMSGFVTGKALCSPAEYQGSAEASKTTGSDLWRATLGVYRVDAGERWDEGASLIARSGAPGGGPPYHIARLPEQSWPDQRHSLQNFLILQSERAHDQELGS